LFRHGCNDFRFRRRLLGGCRHLFHFHYRFGYAFYTRYKAPWANYLPGTGVFSRIVLSNGIGILGVDSTHVVFYLHIHFVQLA
jgi:hypothetical protein